MDYSAMDEGLGKRAKQKAGTGALEKSGAVALVENLLPTDRENLDWGTDSIKDRARVWVKPGRLLSLDVFRGMTIAAMILVNNAGGPAYGPLDHAEWNGWTHTDLIFPFFLFIAGVSMALSFSARLSRGASRTTLAMHTLRRGTIIFAIGLWLNAFPFIFNAQYYAHVRIPGVLQRIGFCYVTGGMIYLATGAGRGERAGEKLRTMIVVLGLCGYWVAMKLIPVPGVGAGDLSPNNNLAAFVDNAIFTSRHMWQYRVWDPEGLMSSIPAVCTLLIGTFVGELFITKSTDNTKEGRLKTILQADVNPPVASLQMGHPDDPTLSAKGALRGGHPENQVPRRAGNDNSNLSQSTWQYKVKHLLTWGTAGVAIGEVWNLWFPINKNLWTSSYVAFTAGYAMLALAALYWVVDVKGWQWWTKPFRVLGMNAILAFTLSTFVTKNLLIYKVASGKGSVSAWSWLIRHTYWPHFADVRNSSLAFALTYLGIWWAVMWWFYKKRIFLKV